VRLRLRSDVAVGSSLSGGVDSSTVVAAIRNVEPGRPLHVFTASFPGHSIDEWDRARTIAEQFGAQPHRVEPTVDGFLESLPLLVRRQGGPFDSPSVYAQWCVMQEAAAAGVIVLLDGQGADETWGGYRKYMWFAFGDGVLRGDFTGCRRILHSWRQANDLPRPDPMQIVGLALSPQLRALARGGLRRAQHWIGPALRDTQLVDPQGTKVRGPLLRQAAIADGRRVLLPRLLRYADRNSMAWSRELRLPFLDERVVELALASGWRGGFQSGWTKERLRRVAARRVPDSIAWRRDKTAYDVPDREWLMHPGLQEQARAAFEYLERLQIVTPGRRAPLSIWRALSLASFLEQSRLTA
jgi:asparagine synthase (glutamine-hydrolysing)